MPASIFAGSKVKTLKSTLSLNGGADVISSTVDPTSVAVDASPGSILLNTTSGKQYRKNDSGSSTNWTEVGAGTSGINYITNPSASTNTTGWATYADAAGAQPVDGTGGSPNVTWTRSTTTPLRGAADFNFSKDAANRQGQGVATDITIDLADQAKVLTVSFDYEVLSGTYADSDLTVYLIADPTGTPVVIQPAGYVVQNATVGTKMRQIATFQTQATGQTYRVCFHVASTSASAYTLAIDNVVVGPQVVQYGAPVTDWQSYSVNWTASTTNPVIGNGTLSGQYARIGQNLRAEFAFKAGSTTTFGSGTWFFSIPSGLSIDTAKILLTDAASLYLGTGEIRDATGNIYTINAVYQDATKVALVPDNAGAFVQSSIPFTWATGDTLSVRIEVPILGWSSTVQMSNDTDTRVVAARYENGIQAIGNPAPITASSKIVDTHMAFSGSTFTVPVSGIYECAVKGYSTGSPFAAATQSHLVRIYKNGANQGDVAVYIANAAGTVYEFLQGSAIVPANAGDTLQFYGVNNGVAFSLDGIALDFKRLSGPSAIAASETVSASYQTTAGQSIPNNISTFINFLNAGRYFDTHGMITEGTGYNSATGGYTVQPRLTVPISGKYLVTRTNRFDVNTTGNSLRLGDIYVNGSFARNSFRQQNGDTTFTVFNGSTLLNLNAGDYIQFSIFQLSGGNLILDTVSGGNFFTIVRVGN